MKQMKLAEKILMRGDYFANNNNLYVNFCIFLLFMIKHNNFIGHPWETSSLLLEHMFNSNGNVQSRYLVNKAAFVIISRTCKFQIS